MAANWSQETYRLDRVCDKCSLPCVVQVTEGICMDSEAESVSAGDIIKIDKHTRIPKVAANFASAVSQNEWREINASEGESEIFVPLNYQGKVKIVSELKKYNSIKALADASPRYAEVMKPLAVVTENKEKLTIPVGVTIQLDRVIPGLRRGGTIGPDKLVIAFNVRGENHTVAVPVDQPGQLRALPDDEEYTLKQVVDRYKLPQTVEFLKNDLRKVYIETLEDVAENARVITDTLRLNRVVTQEMLIGHYKPLEEVETQNEAGSQRTLVLLPLDAEFVREIEVNVLEDATEDDYERLCFVRDQSKAVAAVEEMIYVDFAKKSTIVRLDDIADYEKPIAQNRAMVSPDRTGKPPPRPPKPKQDQTATSGSVCTYDNPPPPPHGIYDCPPPPRINDYTLQRINDSPPPPPHGIYDCPPPPRINDYPLQRTIDYPPPPPHGIYDYPPSPRPVKHYDQSSQYDYVRPAGKHKPSDIKRAYKGGDGFKDDGYIEPDFNIAAVDFTKKGELPRKKPSFLKLFKDKVYSSNKNVKHHAQPPLSPTSPSRTPMSGEDQDDDNDYERIDDNYIPPSNPPNKRNQPAEKRALPTHKPMACVSPQSAPPKSPTGTQSFKTLTIGQLYERLQKCGMSKFAEICKDEGLDGRFIAEVGVEIFHGEPFNLKTFEIKKLEIIKSNWVPH